MDELRELVRVFPTGPALVGALEELGPSPVPELVLRVLKERDLGSGGARAGGESRGAPTYEVSDISCVQPRGKHRLALYENELVLASNKGEVAVPYAAVRSVLILDSLPNDTKGRVLLYLDVAPEAGVRNGKQLLRAVVLQTLGTDVLRVAPQAGGDAIEGVAAVVLSQLLGKIGIPPECFSSPDPNLFTSSKGRIGIEAHVKAKPGSLIPMPGGLLFLESPAMLLRNEEIIGMELARATGASATFDVYVNVTERGDGAKKGSVVEFSALPREEIASLEAYIRRARFSTSIDAGSEREPEPESDTDSSSDSDEEFDPSHRRSTSRSARESGESGSDESEEGESASESQTEDGSEAELVSEDDFSTEALRKVSEGQGREGKRRRAK